MVKQTKSKVKPSPNKSKSKNHSVGVFIDIDKKQIIVKSDNPERLYEFLNVDSMMVHMKQGMAIERREFNFDTV